MASVQELLLALETKKSPLQSLLEAGTRSFGQAYAQGPQRAMQEMDLRERQSNRERQEALRREAAAAQEAQTRSKLGAVGGGDGVHPSQKLQKTVFSEDEKGMSKKIEIVDPEAGHAAGNQPLTSEQLGALASEDETQIAKAFPGGIPLQALRFGTMFRNSRAIEEERGLKRQDRRSDERVKLVDRFNADPSIKKAQGSIDAANTIRGLVDSNNPIAAAAIPTFMARASGEVGNLSEADKRPFGGSQAILERIEAAAKQAASGRLSSDNAKFISELATIMEKRASDNIDNLARTRSKQYSRASDFLKEEDIFSSLRPESEYSVEGSAPKAAKSGGIALTGDKAKRLAELREKAAKGGLK